MKKFINRNWGTIMNGAYLAREMIENYAEIAGSKKPVDYVKFGLQSWMNYRDYFRKDEPVYYFKNWETLHSTMMCEIVVDLLSDRLDGVEPVCRSEHETARVVEVYGEEVGVYTGTGPGSVVFGRGSWRYALHQLIWEKGSRLMMGSEKDRVYLREDSKEYVKTSGSKKYIEKISMYLKRDEYRSCLFYGPAGSGKSNLVREIVEGLGLKSLRINGFGRFGISELMEIVDLIKPEALILEDLDHGVVETEEMLGILENMNDRLKVVLGTANKVGDLGKALVRPGRFDCAYLIERLEGEVLREMVGGDEEIFEKVREFPAAYVVELMKRIRVEGREVAMESIGDLEERVRSAAGENYGF